MKGYTLIEILVSITILSLIFVMGYAGFREFSRRQLLASSVRSLTGDLRLAQSKAAAGEKPDKFNCRGTNRLQGYLFEILSSTEYRLSAKCTSGNEEVKAKTIPTDLTIEASIQPILFKVLGEGTNLEEGTSSLITISEAAIGKSQTVTVTAGGEIK
jgi:prepilin-type N-terminal cleavage/methylation domain-containing protein